MRCGRRLQLTAVGVFIVVYSGLSHYSNSHEQAHGLATILALAPMLTLGTILIWRWRGPGMALLAAAAAGLLCDYCWPQLTRSFALVYLIQQLGFHGLMAATFGLSLLPERVPLCTQFADKVHGPLGAPEVRYTRQVTAAWTIFFLANAAANVLLYALEPLRIWSMFVNFASLPLLALMFVAEYAVRRRVLNQVETGGLMATLRVYFADPR
jgi:uncharacterized membrane protein